MDDGRTVYQILKTHTSAVVFMTTSVNLSDWFVLLKSVYKHITDTFYKTASVNLSVGRPVYQILITHTSAVVFMTTSVNQSFWFVLSRSVHKVYKQIHFIRPHQLIWVMEDQFIKFLIHTPRLIQLFYLVMIMFT